MTEHMVNGGPVGVSDSSEVTEVTPPSNTATFARVAVLLLLTTAYLERAYNDARVTPPPRHVRIGPWRRITSNCPPTNEPWPCLPVCKAHGDRQSWRF